MNERFYRFACALVRFFCCLFLPYRAEGLSHVPDTGAVILCGNHESLGDPVFAGLAIKRPVCFMAKRELFDVRPLGFLLTKLGMIPVDRGSGDMSAVRAALAILKSGGALGIYPQGKRAFKGGAHFQTGVALLALRSRAPVVPVYVDGRARLFRRTTLRFGAPVDLSAFASPLNGAILTDATAAIERAVYALKNC